MANVFTNSLKSSIGTTSTVIYTSPSANVSTVIGLSLSNRTASNTITVSAAVLDSSNSNNVVYIVNNSTVPIGGTLVVVGGDQKLILKANDSVQITSSANNSVDAILSVLQMY